MAFDEQNFSHICPESVNCDFDSKIESKSLKKICKNNCYNEHYLDHFIYVKFFNNFKLLNVKTLSLSKSIKYEIIWSDLSVRLPCNKN
jgi:hypothetical protein